MMRASYLLPLIAFSILSNVYADPAPAEPADMKQIFNGKDLTGWDGDPRLWSVVDGVIRGETTADKAAKGNTFLIWKDGKLADFDLRLSFRVSTENNSGIQYRSRHVTEGVRNDWVVRGYQHEIRNSNKMPNVAGFIYEEGGKRGRVCLAGQKGEWKDGKLQLSDPVITAEEFEKLFKVDEWNEVAIIAEGTNVKHYLNGRLILDFTDADPKLALTEGILALQLHAGAPMWVEFKDIRIKND